MRARPPPQLFALLGATAVALCWGCTLLNWGDYRAGGFGGGTITSATSAGSGMGGDLFLGSWPDSATTYCADGTMKVPCPTSSNTDYHGQDGDYTLRVPTYQLIGAGNDVALIDTVTGLVWEADFAAITVMPVDWALGNMHCEALRNKKYAGMPTWRLPGRRELATLIDAGHAASFFPTEFDPLVMDATQNSAFYWTSTDADRDTNNAWIYRFVPVPVQGVDDAIKTYMPSGRAMCVGGPMISTAPSLTLDNEIVNDASTGFAWQRMVAANQMLWPDALKYCQTLIANGTGGFRLPSIKELLSIVDDSRSSPCLDPVFFQGVTTGKVWTSSPSPANPQAVWTVDLSYGTATPDAVAGIMNKVLCVR